MFCNDSWDRYNGIMFAATLYTGDNGRGFLQRRINARGCLITAQLASVCVFLFLILAGRTEVSACSVPVFRYALERWAPDTYGVVVFHQGPLTPEQQGQVDRMDPAKLPADEAVNLSVTQVDLADAPEAVALKLWEEQGTDTLPWMIVSYPWTNLAQDSIWAGPLTESAVDQVLDSPVRREVARRLLKGESAVWVFLESGDSALDGPAFERLNSRLAHLSETLELPVLNPDDIEKGLISIDESELAIAFSTLRLSRDDPAESFFTEMLLGTEEDLRDFAEPMVFPIFGRGRVLYALIGEGIAPQVIDEAGVFLTGACSCEVKEQNPGVDLAMSVDWDRLVTTHYDLDRELPPLSGFVGFAPESAKVDSSETETGVVTGTATDSESEGGNNGSDGDSSDDLAGADLIGTDFVEESGESGPSSFVVNTLIVCGLLGFGAFFAGMLLLRKTPEVH